MKIPRGTAEQSLRRGPNGLPGRPAAIVPAAAGWRLSFCTANLYETGSDPGHPWLKHCSVRLDDGAGRVEHWGYGRSGLVAEAGITPSIRCEALPRVLDEREKAAFMDALRHRAAQGYAWGGNDCCSILSAACREGVGVEPPGPILEAATGIGGVEEVWPW